MTQKKKWAKYMKTVKKKEIQASFKYMKMYSASL